MGKICKLENLSSRDYEVDKLSRLIEGMARCMQVNNSIRVVWSHNEDLGSVEIP